MNKLELGEDVIIRLVNYPKLNSIESEVTRVDLPLELYKETPNIRRYKAYLYTRRSHE